MSRLLIGLWLVTSFLPSAIQCQNIDKVERFVKAIAKTEGFRQGGHNIPSRYHNPGDLKCNPKLSSWCTMAGIHGTGKGGHTIFKNDAAGWTALRTQVTMILEGRSRNFNKDMTINQMAMKYARNWRQWANYVAKELKVSPTMTLADYFELPVPAPQVWAKPWFDEMSKMILFPTNPILPLYAKN
jgi:hypothetical protein